MNKFRMMSVFVVLAMLFGFANVSPASAVSVTFFSADFNSGVPSEFSGTTTAEGVQGYAGLGTDLNVFGGDFLRNSDVSGAATTLTLTNLPPHDSISLSFLLAIIDSWDGDISCFGTNDGFNVSVDGTTIFSEAFENSTCGVQTYIPSVGVELARRASLGFNTTAVYFGDSAYDMGLDPTFQNIPHTSSTLTIEWFTSGSGWQGGDDESWAIDNVQVILNNAAPGAIVQLDATTLAQLNGETVITWGGQNAAGNPTYLENQTPNGMPAVEFNGGGDRMGDNIPLSPSTAGDWIVVAVIKPSNVGNYHNLVDDDASNRPMLWIDPGFRYELNFGGGSGARSAGTGTDGWDIVIVDSRLNQLYVNSPTSNATGGGAIPFAAAESFDFFHRDGNQTFQGLVAELRVYNDRDEFGGDFGSLHSEMYAKWIQTSVIDSDGDGVPDDEDAFPNDETRAVSCAPGYYGAFECTPAPAGTFVDSAGSLVATPCAIGTYQPAAGAVACIAAPIGSYVDSVGAVAATACPAGSTTAAAASTSASDCNFPPAAVANGPYLVAVGQQVILDSTGSSDPDLDPLTETWTANGGTVSGNVFTAGSVPGIYDVQLVVNDGTVDSLPATTMVVVYDPSGGFVTGGGWIDSPVNANYQYMQTGGKANFGFVAKYKKGANVPDGNTQFQFKAGDLNFHSSSYEWLVVAGNQAMFKGEGTINGQGSYMFMITADDDNPDTFRIKIWYEENGVEIVVYDNGSQQALGGGSIVIHK